MIPGILLLTTALGLLIVLIVILRRPHFDTPVAARLQEAGASRPPASVAELPSQRALQPTESSVPRRGRPETQQPTLRDRLVQAGLYRAYSPLTFLFVRIGLGIIPVTIGLAAGLSGTAPLFTGLAAGGVISGLATLAPSFWLDWRKRHRQQQIRRSLPDALDVIVVCMEGGLSLEGALAKVVRELADAHPLLAMELRIAQREVQMGRTMAEALRGFAVRFDMEELRSLAAVVGQAERFGTSVVRALSTYAETMRLRRHQRAEELAHQAAIKMIFPTLLCIFPAIFVVILGPAAIRGYDLLFGPEGLLGR